MAGNRKNRKNNNMTMRKNRKNNMMGGSEVITPPCPHPSFKVQNGKCVCRSVGWARQVKNIRTGKNLPISQQRCLPDPTIKGRNFSSKNKPAGANSASTSATGATRRRR